MDSDHEQVGEEMSISIEADPMESGVPPGFRFHPTEEELVGYYLTRKINSMEIDLDVIVEIDLYKMEPWDIQDKCKLGGNEEQSEWYFFSHKDKKYPTGTRTNRATAAGFWKATGRDKAVLSKNQVIGMRKTLVFYQGRAPNGRKSDWIMHEYRLQTQELVPPQPQDGEWVVCRAFRKPVPNQRQGFEAWNHAYYMKEYKTNFFGSPSTNNPSTFNQRDQHESSSLHQSCGMAMENELFPNNHSFVDNHQHELPQLTTEDYEGSEVIGNNNGNTQHYLDWKDHCANPIASSSDFTLESFALEDDRNHINHFLGYFNDS